MGKLSFFYCSVAFFISILCTTSTTAQTPSQEGAWGDVIPFEIVPVAVANLPDGQLITWSSQFPNTFVGSGTGMTLTQLFDPAIDATLPATTTQTDHDMFCPGINNLSDGRILSAGGTSSQRTSIYDPSTGTWSKADDMNVPRGYQGNVTLSDGSVFTVGGSWDVGPDGGKNAELWTPETGWSYLPGIDSDDFLHNANDRVLESQGLFRLDNHVWLWPAPNGTIFQAGPGEQMHWIDVNGNNGAGSWVTAGQRSNDTYSMKGTTVMFDIGKVLKVGGSRSYDSNTPAKERSFVIDINGTYGSTATVTETANTLEFARTMHNSTVLPNGEVLVTGGLDHAETFTDIGAALTAEIYNPTTNSWRSVAGMATPRTYHSVAILLLDGRVFVGGGGLCDNTPGCVNNDNAEIYSPPYLFDATGNLATRPEIITTPLTADYNSSITVETDRNVSEFSLIRFSAATHSTNNEQRRIPLATVEGTSHTLTIPDRNLLPPGYYMLFALNADGVPSVAKAIRIGTDIPLVTDPSLVLDLKFDDASGSDLADASQYANDASIYDVDNNRAVKEANSNSLGTGLFGGALVTDGFKFQSNTIAEIPYSESIASIDRFVTVLAWVKRDEVVNNASIFTHDYPNMFFGFHNSLYKWEFDTDQGRASCYAGYTPPGVWVHMAATYDGETARLYANGQEISAKLISGNIRINPSEPDFSSFNVSGFYERRTNPSGDYNGSGVTDELDGSIDELKVYNKVLNAEEIKAIFDLGQGLPMVPECVSQPLVAEYKIGASGTWISGANVNANEGEAIYIRIKDFSDEFLITIPEIDGDTFSSLSDFNTADGYRIGTGTRRGDNDGLLDSEDSGQYVLTTTEGCLTVINLSVIGVCGPEDTPIIPEYRLNGVWQSGENNLNVEEGTEVMFSILPNNLDVTVTFPDGTVVGDDYNLGEVTNVQNGPYILTSAEGCSTIVHLTVGDAECPEGTIVPEYTIDGVAQSGANTITVDEGQEVILSILPDNLGTIITLPNGAVVGDNYVIDGILPAQSGEYTFTSTTGCTATLNIDVTAGCSPGQIIPEYRLDGVWDSGLNDLNVAVGTEVMFSMLPNYIGVTVTFPDGTVVGDDFNIGAVDESDSGAYTLLSAEGCSTNINLTVGDANCLSGDVVPVYTIDGITQSGAGAITIQEGQSVVLSILPDGVGAAITLPNGDQVGDTYDLGHVAPAQSGTYTFTSSEGCVETLDITVEALSCQTGDLIPEYTIDGSTQSGSGTITILEGQSVVLSMLPDGIGLTITLPSGTEVVDNYDLGNVVPSQSGIYTFTSADGCVETLDIIVEAADNCQPGQIIPEYRLDGIWDSGLNDLTVAVGTEVMFSMLPNNIGVTVEFPDGTIVGDDFNIGTVTPANNGAYILRSSQGCTTIINLMVGDEGCQSGDVLPEYTIDGITQSGADAITIQEGQSVVLSMLPDGVGLTITLPNGTQVGDDYDLGNVVSSQSGIYTFTSAEGCVETLDITVETISCQAGDVIPEYTIDGITQSGAGAITIQEGQSVVLSMLPDGVGLTITLPNGTQVGDDYDLGNVVPSQSGIYTFTSAEGCVETLDITVETISCQAGDVIPEYTIDGITQSGAGAITIQEGQSVVLSMLPDGVSLTITLPNGTEVGDNHDLGNVVPSQSGIYTFTSAEGCVETLDITVETISCQAGDVIPEYTIDGITQSGAGAITVQEGQSVLLSMLPDGVGLTITLPNGDQVGDNYNLGNVIPSQSGIYTFTSAEGCGEILDITVEADDNCQPGQIIPEYRLNGIWDSGLNDLTVAYGTGVMFSMLPNNIGVTVEFPDGTIVGDNYNIGAVTPTNNGAYILRSSQGCQTTINLTVEEQNCQPDAVIPEYTVDGNTQSGAGNITVEEGQLVVLSMVPDGIGLTITLPSGAQVGDNYNLGNIIPSQGGIYTFTSDAGCVETLTINVNPASCQPGDIIPEYRLDGIWSSGLNDLTVDEGTEVMFSMLPNNIGVTVEFPNGTVVGDDFNIGAVTSANNGAYVLTSSAGCQTTINLTVASASRADFNTGTADSTANDTFTRGVSMVYPNPTEGLLHINLNGFENQQLVAMVFNSMGQLVFESHFNKEHGVQEQIDLNTLPDGLYRLTLQSATHKQIHSVLIRR
ncbi:DUF1929 domain-containing protein [Aggregatimonas sangjinii]|uniref:DUF1929 domain-containing protein n=1 Tax=Aggregatimonas sangjinii TaxID=2583587 RepID=A0A5B7SNG6_9FLAO|nr:galactose oxidase-like domain-containing protein [Aggregatimonas sangjinii]QCW99681.1 DUF1929 domain-containing protein [Aggregatimonas sangjinii]